MALMNEIEHITNISNTIQSQPDGYDTQISENGNSVSSGQAQQISLSRALYHRTDIILFDEPTSNLDKESIDVFKEMINKIKENRIIIIVSHDENITRSCDFCYRLENMSIT